MNEIEVKLKPLAVILIIIIFILSLWLLGCTAIGTADRPAMMSKWRGQPVTENLLADINRYGNWAKKGDLTESGKCIDQAMYKANILKELGIPYKIGHCTIVRDPYKPVGHRFLVAQLKNKWMILDNGAVQNGVFEYKLVKKSTFGVINWRKE